MRAQIDPSSISLNDMMRKLKAEDPNHFRQVMDDLRFRGQDPGWYTQGLVDEMKNPSKNSSTFEQQLRQQREQLVKEKAQLATELTRVQNLLNLQVEIDRKQSSVLEAEMTQIQDMIKLTANKQSKLNEKIKN